MENTYFIVTYIELGEIEGVFTKKSFERYLKEGNEERSKNGEVLETIDEFSFKPVIIHS